MNETITKMKLISSRFVSDWLEQGVRGAMRAATERGSQDWGLAVRAAVERNGAPLKRELMGLCPDGEACGDIT